MSKSLRFPDEELFERMCLELPRRPDRRIPTLQEPTTQTDGRITGKKSDCDRIE